MPVEVYLPNKGKVVLNEATDFRAKGGEGAVYVKAGLAYKVYEDAGQMIPPGKIAELAALDRPNILRPLDVLRDRRGHPVGYTMRGVTEAIVLCRMFPQTFRAKHRLAPERVLHLVRRMQDGVRFVHSHGVLVVDLNEMNFLLNPALDEVFFIDVNTYQTRTFPATALMESVRDRHCGGVFTEGSDWFSFAVVSFAMFVGIHPYKGSHPRFGNANHWPEHMERNLSVLNPEVSVPAACLPLQVIPQVYRDWYRAVLEEGKRLPPPEDLQHVVVVTPPARGQRGSSLFLVEEVARFREEILAHCDGVTVTAGGVYLGARKVLDTPGDVSAGVTASSGGNGTQPAGNTAPSAGNLQCAIGLTPRLRQPLVAWVDAGMLRLYDLTRGAPIPTSLAAEQVMGHEGRLYVKQGTDVFELEPVELADRTLVGARPAGNVTANSTTLYDGVAVQNLLGAVYVLLFPAAGTCHSVRLPELERHVVVDAQASGNVLVVAASKAGRYDRFVFRFGEGYRTYDCRVVSDVPYQGVNCIALDGGVCLCLAEEDGLELFSCRPGATEVKLLRDPALGGDIRLFSRGGALFTRGDTLYRFRMR